MGNSIKRKRVDGLCGPKETVQSNQIMKLIWFVAVSAESSQRQFIHQLKKIKVLFSLLIGMKMAKWAEWTKQIISLNFIQTTIEWNGEMNCLCEWSGRKQSNQKHFFSISSTALLLMKWRNVLICEAGAGSSPPFISSTINRHWMVDCWNEMMGLPRGGCAAWWAACRSRQRQSIHQLISLICDLIWLAAAALPAFGPPLHKR